MNIQQETIPEEDEDGIRKSTEEIAQVKEEIKQLEESDEEEKKDVEAIEGAHVTRLNAEKDDNENLKRRLSQM